MAKHTNKVIPLFLVTHCCKTTDNVLHLIGYILEGQLRNWYFSVQYFEISKEEFINSKNDESQINFNSDDNYYRLTVFISKNDIISELPEEIQNNLVLIKDNCKNGEFNYSNYMNHVAYIIMSGMLTTGI
jgi:hypothetical protein